MLLAALMAVISLVSLAADRPNILLIVSDDQGWPDLGCIGLKANPDAESRPTR